MSSATVSHFTVAIIKDSWFSEICVHLYASLKLRTEICGKLSLLALSCVV
jgi:hypothetical protein